MFGILKKEPRGPILTKCPETGATVRTHAYMSEGEVRRVRWRTTFFCSVCKVAHQVEPEQLYLR